jgi:phytoene synthase
MGRVYLPEEDLSQYGLEPNDLLTIAPDRGRLAQLLEFEAQRARDYYESADELIPLIHEDSRPALWVMVTIYKRLLEKIGEARYDVFHQRVRLSTFEKLSILAKGFGKSVLRTL